MTRGRPIKSDIRQNIVDILYFLEEGYGYDIFKVYKEAYPKCTNEVIYYHLKKGVLLGEFAISRIKEEKGDFSWGPVSKKIFYKLGDQARPRASERIKKIVHDHVRKSRQKQGKA